MCCQPTKESKCYNLPLHTHDEDHFHHLQILKLASGTLTERNLQDFILSTTTQTVVKNKQLIQIVHHKF